MIYPTVRWCFAHDNEAKVLPRRDESCGMPEMGKGYSLTPKGEHVTVQSWLEGHGVYPEGYFDKPCELREVALVPIGPDGRVDLSVDIG